MNRIRRLEILREICREEDFAAVDYLASFWQMKIPSPRFYNFTGLIEDLQHIEEMQDLLQVLMASLRLGDRMKLERAESYGYRFMQKQTEMSRLQVLVVVADDDLNAIHNANVREWTYRVLSGDKTPEEVLLLCNELLERIERILA